jgi:hypothetical protein
MHLAPFKIRCALFRFYMFDFPRLVVLCASAVTALRPLIVHLALPKFYQSGPTALGISKV